MAFAMPGWLKIALGVAGAVVLGFLVGYFTGSSGASALTAKLGKAEARANAAEQMVKQEAEKLTRQRMRAKRARAMLAAKEHVLRALVQLHANNFGLASQHLAVSREKLRVAKKRMKGEKAKAVDALVSRLGSAHATTMRLDPMARVQIEQLVAEMDRKSNR